MKITKMHGIGNDYVYVNCIENQIEDPSSLAVTISDRHFGVGSDGLILIKSSDKADFMMDMYNADGSRGMMCGNGIRCVGKYVYDHGLTDKKIITIETLSGIKTLNLSIIGENECSGHSECDAIIMDSANVTAIPALVAKTKDASLIHEAVIGKIAGEQLIKLMTLGLDEAEAESRIINGFLK